jgi:signal transduction histidine kinase
MKLLAKSFLLFLLLCHNDMFSQMYLKNVFVNGVKRNLPKNSTIYLTENEFELRLEFIAKTPSNITYEYSLTEIVQKPTWNATIYPTASFQDIKGGEFNFKIRPKNNPHSIVLKIFKAPPFYHEWWMWPLAIAYILLLIGVGIYLFFLYDFRQKLKMQHVRNQIAADLHDEVGSNLNSIAIYTEVLRKAANGKSTDILDKITANSRESVSLMQDTVWMINPKNDSTEKLLDRMRSFASEILATKNISLEFNAPADLKKVNFNMDQRKNCYLVFKEAINNIVKHADASKVAVNITHKNDEIDIIIEDNGKGFDTSELHEGNGLQNFKERAIEAEFDLNIDSQKGVGTKISMKIVEI